MNIQTRMVSGLVASLALALVAVLHLVWAFGLSFPAPTSRALEDAVLGGHSLPNPIMTIAVAMALLVAVALIVIRLIDLNRSRLVRSRLVRVGVYGVAVVLLLRAAGGLLVSSLSLAGIEVPEVRPETSYPVWDLAVYSPLCLILGLCTLAVAGQGRPPKDLRTHALHVLRSVSLVNLTTVGPDGAPRGRVVQRVHQERDGTLWIATDRSSQKCREIEADPRVLVSAYNPAAQAAVNVSGHASVVDDPEVLAHHWFSPFRLYFTQGRSDPRYVLLRIELDSFSLIDFSRDVTPEPFGLRNAQFPAAALPEAVRPVIGTK